MNNLNYFAEVTMTLSTFGKMLLEAETVVSPDSCAKVDFSVHRFRYVVKIAHRT